MRFGRQRPAADLAALALLLLGFCGLGLAVWLLRANWLGLVLPLTFILGAAAGLRAEVRELELRADALVLRTFFRSYAMPRTHITNVVMTPRGVAIDVLNGTRYFINPEDVDPQELYRALREWLGHPDASRSSNLP